MCLAVLTSNSPMQLQNIDDDGGERRVNLWDTKFKFVEQPSQLTHKKADPRLKDSIDAGIYNCELNFWFRFLYDMLSDDICKRSEVVPKPSSIIAASAALFAGNLQERLVELLTSRTNPVKRSYGTAFKEVKECITTDLGVADRPLHAVLTKVGIDPKGMGNSKGVRVLLWAHPEWTGSGVPALKLK